MITPSSQMVTVSLCWLCAYSAGRLTTPYFAVVRYMFRALEAMKVDCIKLLSARPVFPGGHGVTVLASQLDLLKKWRIWDLFLELAAHRDGACCYPAWTAGGGEREVRNQRFWDRVSGAPQQSFSFLRRLFPSQLNPAPAPKVADKGRCEGGRVWSVGQASRREFF